MTLGFIVLRHVTSLDTDRYWKLCYERIRQYYPENEIIIIDDNEYLINCHEDWLNSDDRSYYRKNVIQ